MKPIWLHGIYLSIIGVLSFQLWSRAATANAAFAEIDTIISHGLNVIKDDNGNISSEIEKQIYTNIMKYGMYKEPTKHIAAVTKNTIDFLTKSYENRDFNIENLKKRIEEHSKVMDISIPDQKERTLITKQSHIHKLLSSNAFWQSMKTYPSVFTTILKQQILADETLYLKYFHDKVSGQIEIICGPLYKIAISPKKAALLEGETFEADIYITKYYSNFNEIVSIVVGKDTLQMKDQISHYEKKERTTGLKMLEAKAILKNRATGEVMSLTSQFEYHVFPKCSESCQ